MATIEARKNKNGVITSYRITVAGGIDSFGKQIRHRKTWKPDPNKTERQNKKALDRAVADFEKELEQGYHIDHRQTFAKYAAYVLDLKERTGAKPNTIDGYWRLMPRINTAIGHIKLADLRPQHLNAFYANLAESGIRQGGDRAAARVDIRALLKEQQLSKAELARRAGISVNTVDAATQGKNIIVPKAEAIAAVLGREVSDLFHIKQDTRPLSEKTIMEYHRLISIVMAQAEKEMLVQYNPAAKATPPRIPQTSPDYFQSEQMNAILDALDTEPLKWRAITYLMINTGCRRGEAIGLKWDNINWNTGVITIDRALLYNKQRGVYEGTTKTGRSRALKLAPEVLDLLRQYKSEYLRLRLANGDRWNDTGYVFTQDNGLPMNPCSVTSWLNKFSRAHNLPHIHPHAFRHTAVSMMIADGNDLVTVASDVGHANATTTANIYAHQIAEAKAKAAESRSSVFKHRRQTKPRAEQA